MRKFKVLSFIIALSIAATPAAFAQHHHHHGHGHSYWGSGHYHYQPGHYDVHRNHLHYHPGTTVYHSNSGVVIGGHNHGHHHHYYGGYAYGAGWLTPIVTQPVIAQPSTVVIGPTVVQQQQLPEPKFGAYAQVPRVAADLASFANNMCLTMHQRFQNQPSFTATYRVAYSVLRQSEAVRDLSGNFDTREEITKRLPIIDEDMHRVVAEISPWMNNQSAGASDAINALKQDVGKVGGALHYLMVDVGVAHKDQDPATAARPAQPVPPPPVPTADRPTTKPAEPIGESIVAKPETQQVEPKFGGYTNVSKVSSDVAVLANRLCLTMHRGFSKRDDFDDAYAAAYDVLQQSQRIRDLAREPGNRQEVTKRLEKLDDGMHRVFAEVGEWIDDPKEAGNRDIENLKREFGTLGNAVHYLMTDVGVKHHDDEGEEPAAPPPKPKARPTPLLTPE